MWAFLYPGTHVRPHKHARIDRRGVPSSSQHPGTTSLVTPFTDRRVDRWGKMDRGRQGAMGDRFKLRWGRQGRVEERRTHATLHGARLLGKPRLLLFPQECRRADSQSGSSSIFATTTHKLVPKLPVEKETWREMSYVAVWEYIFSSPVPPHRGCQNALQ